MTSTPETWDILVSAPWCQIDPRLLQSSKEVFQAWKMGAIRMASSVWMLPVWKWWVCSVGHCPYSAAQNYTVLTTAETSLTSREPKWRSKLSTVPRMVMSLFLQNDMVLTRLRELLEVPSEIKALKYQKFEVCTAWHFSNIWIMLFWL